MYHKCPHCGCSLDPGERCDCEDIADPEVQQYHPPRGKARYHSDAPDLGMDAYVSTIYRRPYDV